MFYRKRFGFLTHHVQAKPFPIKRVESFVADIKAHPFIKKVFASSQGTRADYLGEECIVRRGRAFTTSCLRNFRLGRHPYGSRGDWPHRRRDHIPDIVKEPCWFFQPSVESQLAPGECVFTVRIDEVRCGSRSNKTNNSKRRVVFLRSICRPTHLKEIMALLWPACW